MDMALSYFLYDLTNKHHIVMASILIITFLYLIYRKRTTIYLLDYTCYKPPPSYRIPMSMFVEHMELEEEFDSNSVSFQIKILEKSGFSQETCVPPSLTQLPFSRSIYIAIDEAKMVIFSVVRELFEKNNITPREVDIVIINSSLFSPTPSLASMVINEFKMRSNIMSFNLSGMGCSAGIISVGLARDLLRVHKNSLALIVSCEIMSLNWYTGKNRSMLLTNCLFRTGAAAILMSSRACDKKKAKYVLEHVHLVHAGGRAVISGIQKSLKMKEEDIEASRMTLYRFGNTSSSSIWYELSYTEAKGRMKIGDRVLQIGFGSGFKCNSVVWRCVADVKVDETNPWWDRIHLYPVQVPETINIV